MNIIEAKYGNDGYAVWFKLLEQLGKANNHYLNLSDETNVMFLASVFRISEELTLTILTDLAKLEAIDKFLWDNHRVIWSEKFIDSIQDAYRKRNSSCIQYTDVLTIIGVKNVVSSGSYSINGANTAEDIPKEKESKEKESKEEYYSFDEFWNLYPIKIAKSKCQPKYESLKNEEKVKIKATLERFLAYKPFKDYNHPNPLTYLNQSRFNDVIPDGKDPSAPKIQKTMAEIVAENRKYEHITL